MDKINKCRYALPTFKENKVAHNCVKNGFDNICPTSKSICKSCQDFKNRYIEYPITVNQIENDKITTYSIGHECGCLCEIKPCGEEYNDKTYIGIYIGELPISITTSFDEEKGILKNGTMHNPAIFVPELKKIIYGCESWWRVIESIDDFTEISDEDIENTWYVKLLKSFTK